jgi:hypothetical protein
MRVARNSPPVFFNCLAHPMSALELDAALEVDDRFLALVLIEHERFSNALNIAGPRLLASTALLFSTSYAP